MSRLEELVRNLPVAKFHYKGQSHRRPVRRTVLITRTTSKLITGFEIREGKEVRDVEDAPIKTYRRDKIATRGECRTDSVMRKVGKKRLSETTLVRSSLASL